MTVPDHYSVLGVLPTADDVVIRAAYLALANRYNPATWNGHPREAAEKIAEISVAYAVLSDPNKRSAFDQSLREQIDVATGTFCHGVDTPYRPESFYRKTPSRARITFRASSVRRVSYALCFVGIPLTLYLGLTFKQHILIFAGLWAISLVGAMYLHSAVEFTQNRRGQTKEWAVYASLFIGGAVVFFIESLLNDNLSIPLFFLLFFMFLIGIGFAYIPKTASRWIHADEPDSSTT